MQGESRCVGVWRLQLGMKCELTFIFCFKLSALNTFDWNSAIDGCYRSVSSKAALNLLCSRNTKIAEFSL